MLDEGDEDPKAAKGLFSFTILLEGPFDFVATPDNCDGFKSAKASTGLLFGVTPWLIPFGCEFCCPGCCIYFAACSWLGRRWGIFFKWCWSVSFICPVCNCMRYGW